MVALMSVYSTIYSILLFILLFVACLTKGDLEPTFARCCALGANWARESQKCLNFPAPVPGEPSEHQSICLTAASICCLRFYRESQCESAKQAAKSGSECTTSSEPGGEFFKDCCDGCKLGLVTGSMAMNCAFQGFSFGFPWNDAYLECCIQASPPGAVDRSILGGTPTVPSPHGNAGIFPDLATDDENFLYANRVDGKTNIPDSENLCLLFPGQLCGHVCVPTPGSFVCQCRMGFTLSVDGKTCIQEQIQDRCEVNNPCDHVCRDTGVSIECSCNPGFQLALDQRTCNDVNECSLGTHICGSSEVCINTQGSYECQIRDTTSDCPPGYKYNAQNKICEDVNECNEGLHSCHPSEEICRNIIGAYECDMRCQDGYHFSTDPPSCVDINECLANLHNCRTDFEFCVNTVGSFRCERLTGNEIRPVTPISGLPLPKVTLSTPVVQECPEGFGFDLDTTRCLDINECVSGLHNCTTSTQKCINTLGGFKCTPKAWCSTGYTLQSSTGKCEDIDECSMGFSNCLPGQICVNTIGSFDCRVECRDGFKYEPEDPAICVDVNECLSNPCNYLQQCLNTEGSYVCLGYLGGITQRPFNTSSTTTTEEPVRTTTSTTTSLPTTRRSRTTTTTPKAPCPRGYKRKRRNSECKDINECAEGIDHCLKASEECVNLPGSYTCKPKPCSRGFYIDSETRECIDVDECTNLPCQTNEECINTPGSFVCRIKPTCQDGFRRNSATQECEDINECIEETPCDLITRCINTRGSYRCRSLDCPPGYQRNPVTGQCEDVNECETGEHTCKVPAEECVNSPGTYRCKAFPPCPRGFTRDSKSFRCVDINECKEKSNNCLPSQSCINSAGSFQCVEKKPACNFGFTFNEETKKCEDIDECSEGLHLCSRTREKCLNLEGAYLCDRIDAVPKDHIPFVSATTPHPTTSTTTTTTPTTTTTTTTPPTTSGAVTTTTATIRSGPKIPIGGDFDPKECPKGYVYDFVFRICKDIDECNDSPCDEHEFCMNTAGGFECNCKDGFTKDNQSGECIDVNECQLGLHTCERLQRCDNSLGSYTCTRVSSCGTGYTLNHNTGNCEDDNECVLGTNDCRQLGPKWKCVNTKGSFRCERKTCPSMQILNSWGLCVNITCTPGYKPSNKKCVDINECEDEASPPCKQNELCFNFAGSFECRPKIYCGRGYEMNEVGNQCIDIDECEKNTHTCSGGQNCINRPGGYVCQCSPGYRFNVNRECQDINECQTAYARLCGNSGECVNTPGSYACQCKQGFKKSENSETCVDVDECAEIEGSCQHNCINIWGSHYCTCNAGYKLGSDNRTCSDVNECEEIRGRGRLCLGICLNTPGSFKCTCPSGYRLDEDHRTCKDINECDSINRCVNPEDICVNTRGSFRCQTIACPPNYARDSNHRNRCKKEKLCQEDDAACLQQPLTYSYNFLPLASNMTLRPLGQVDLFTMRGPLWSSTNVNFELELEAATVGREGVSPATREYFLLNRTAFNQVVLTLIKSLEGPQEVQLNLNMKLYHNGYYEGSAVAKLLIFVSQYDF